MLWRHARAVPNRGPGCCEARGGFGAREHPSIGRCRSEGRAEGEGEGETSSPAVLIRCM